MEAERAALEGDAERLGILEDEVKRLEGKNQSMQRDIERLEAKDIARERTLMTAEDNLASVSMIPDIRS